jgi:hypothetical protein
MCACVYKGCNNVDQRKTPSFVHHLQSHVAIVAGESAELNCHVTGFPQPQIIWYRDGVKIADGTDFTIGLCIDQRN